ncbi:MAG: hypothetical protein V7L22_27650 [Nostoc sp.]
MDKNKEEFRSQNSGVRIKTRLENTRYRCLSRIRYPPVMQN